MECNLNTSCSATPSFGRLRASKKCVKFLNNIFKGKDIVEFNHLYESQKANPVDIYLSKKSFNRLQGWMMGMDNKTGKMSRKADSQGLFFDSPIKTLRRLCQKANLLNEDAASAKLKITPFD